MIGSTRRFKYQVSGSLPVGSSSYVTRKADDELYESLLDAEYCNVLNARQMGKSSLRVKTMDRLKSKCYTCIAVDLMGISKQLSEPNWYHSFVSELVKETDLLSDFPVNEWWKQNEFVSGSEGFKVFVERILLSQVEGNIVIFIDELDCLLELP